MPQPWESADLLLVHGDERHLVDDAVRRWRARFGRPEGGVEVIEAPAPIEKVRGALAEMPLFGEQRVVIVRDPPQLGGGRGRGEGGARELADALALRAPTTAVCLVAHVKVAAGNPVLDAVGAAGGATRLCAALKGRELRQWLEREAAERGVQLRPGGLDHLLRVAGSDLGVLGGELEKLRAYSGGRPVELEAVRKLVSGEEGVEVWSVLERLLGPEPARGAAAVDELLEAGRGAQYLIATLAGQLRELIQAGELLARGEGPRGLAAALRMPDWRAERLARQARSVPAAKVRSWLVQLQRADAAIKRGEADDVQALRALMLVAARDLIAARSTAPAR